LANTKKKRGRPKKVKDPAPIIEELEIPDIVEAPIPELLAAPVIQDRMMHYGYQKPRYCPECRSMPVVTMLKRRDYALYRCRACGYKWEIES